ncbi:MAG TPA: hypothetical protein VGO62_10200 [Myxococcota bacterium]
MRALAAASVLAIALALSASCAGAVLDSGDGSSSLAATDPALIENARSLIFSFSTKKTCADLVDLGPAEIAAALASEAAPSQIIAPTEEFHVFGKVPPNTPIAYFVLASSSPKPAAPVGLETFRGSVFAMGCRDFNAPSGTRHDLPLTMFPVGLR